MPYVLLMIINSDLNLFIGIRKSKILIQMDLKKKMMDYTQ